MACCFSLGKHNLIEFRKETDKILEEKMHVKMPANTETYVLDSLGFDSIEIPDNRWKPYCNKDSQVCSFYLSDYFSLFISFKWCLSFITTKFLEANITC